MSSQRLSLSSPALAGRVKKYDSYTHNPATSRRKSKAVSVDNNRTIKSQSLSNSPLEHINKSSRQNIPTNFVTKSTKGSNIALSSVRNSREYVNKDGVITRQFSDDKQLIYTSSKSKTSKLQKAMYVFGALVFVFSTFTTLQTMFTNKQAQDQIAALGVRTDEQGVSEGTGNEPSEGPVSNDALVAYKVSNPEDPRYIRIPSLGVFARIKNLGIDSSGAVDAPWNIYDAGWYNGSARPGNSIGSSLILGHVSGWTASGVFKKLKNLKTGAKFEIEKGNGEIVAYEVTRSESIPLEQVNMSKILGAEEPGKHDLKLMTCSGKYNRDTETYEDRYVVYAKPIN